MPVRRGGQVLPPKPRLKYTASLPDFSGAFKRPPESSRPARSTVRRSGRVRPSRLDRLSSRSRALLAVRTTMSTAPVTIPYASLLSPSPATSALLSSAFSSTPSSQGLVLISALPASLKFPALRTRLLALSNAFAALPEATRESYADPSSRCGPPPGPSGPRRTLTAATDE